MSHQSRRWTTGLAFLAVVALFGMKDTGVFLKDYTPENSEIAYHETQKVEINKEDENFFYIENDGEVAVPKQVLLKTMESGKGLEAKKPTRLYQSINGEVIRFVLSDEFVEIIEKSGDYYKVKSYDGKIGFVSAADMKPADRVVKTEAVAKTNKFLMNHDLLLELKKGETVYVVGYQNGQFELVDQYGNLFMAAVTDVELKKAEPVVVQTPQAQPETAAAINPDLRQAETVKPTTGAKETSVPKVPAKIPTTASAKEKVNQAMQYAKAQLDRPYVYADTGKAGYDCSGFLYDIYVNQLKMNIHRSSYDQVLDGVEVARDELLPGDLVFFNTTDTPNSHVGMYLGDDEFIHASSGGGRVMISDLSEGYYNDRYSTARRVIVD